MSDPIFEGVLDSTFAPGAHIGLGSSDYSMTQEEYKTGLAWTVLGGSRSGAGINLPSNIPKASLWRADPANAFDVTVRCGGSVVLHPGDYVTIVTDKNGRLSSFVLAGPGGAGSSAWQLIDEAYTAVAGDHLDVDTSAVVLTVNLPASPAMYDEVYFRNSAQSFASHALTIGRNGLTIMGVAEDMTVNTNGADFVLWFNGETWQLPGAQL